MGKDDLICDKCGYDKQKISDSQNNTMNINTSLYTGEVNFISCDQCNEVFITNGKKIDWKLTHKLRPRIGYIFHQLAAQKKAEAEEKKQSSDEFKTCSKCNASIKISAKFCAHCGNEV